MDFSDTLEEAEFRAQFRGWLTEHYSGEILTPDDSATQHEFRSRWHKTMYAGGWLGLSWPTEYGGLDLSPLYETIINEELGRAGIPNPVGPLNWLGRALLVFGTEAQRQRHLSPMLKGETHWCQGFSEPGAGSDLASLSTHAVRNGDQYLISGQKLWTSGAQFADYCMVLVKTDREVPKHKGISCLIIPMDAPGITVRPVKQSWGADRFCEVFFDEAPARVEDRLGAEGDGWRLATTVLSYERGPSELGMVATWRRMLRKLKESATGDPVREMEYARSFAAAEACRIHLMQGLSRRARGESPDASSSIDKLLMIRAEQSLAALEFDLNASSAVLGGEQGVTKDYLYSRAVSIYGGTQQIQQNIVAQRILGLPRR